MAVETDLNCDGLGRTVCSQTRLGRSWRCYYCMRLDFSRRSSIDSLPAGNPQMPAMGILGSVVGFEAARESLCGGGEGEGR